MFPYGKEGGVAQSWEAPCFRTEKREGRLPARPSGGPVGGGPRRAVSCFRSERRAQKPGARHGASRPDPAAGEEREVEEVRRQASEGKERSLSRNLVESLPRPGFQI